MATDLPKNALRLDHHLDPVCIDHHKRPLGRVTTTLHAEGETLTDALVDLIEALPPHMFDALTAAMEAARRPV